MALKSIEKLHCRNPEAMPKIFNEVELLNKIDHPNVIKILEIFENPKFYFIVTEFVQKGDLFKMLQKNTYFEEE